MTAPLRFSDEEERRRALIESEPDLRWVVVAWSGLAIAVIGWTDLALLWYPMNFGNAEWELGTISAHLDGMPLGTIGLALLAVGAMSRGWRRITRAVGVVCLVVMVTLIGLFSIYLLTVPVALGGVAPPLLPMIKKGILKASVFTATYTVFYGWLGVFLWRKTRLRKR